MHFMLIPCRAAYSSPSFSLRASGDAVHFYYDHKPDFQGGQRLLPVQKSIGTDIHYNGLQQPSGEHIGCAPSTYRPQLRMNQMFSPDDDDDDDDDDIDEEDDGECIHSTVIAENHLNKSFREGTHDDPSIWLARVGSEHALHSVHTPYFHSERMHSGQTEFCSEMVTDSNVLSMEAMSTFTEKDEEHDTLGEFMTPSTRPLGKTFNQLDFARVYNFVALRVCLAECESLAYRLKGHLLNWPRISNIARVDGDDMDWDTESFLKKNKEQRAESIEDSLLRAVYGSVAPPGPLAKRLRAAGRVSSKRFRYLESLSRPGYKAKKEMRKEREIYTTKRHPKKYYMVELEDCHDEKLGLDPRLQGLDYGKKKRIGPFRLLLMDSKYAGQLASKLPMAVQMLLNETKGHNKWGPMREIVPCKLTLFYAYWSMEEILNHLISQDDLMQPSIKIMGHVAVLSLGVQYFSVKYLIGKVVLDKHRPKVKTVINKLEPVEGNYNPAFEVLAGNHSVVTTIVEDGIPFLVNLATVYWDSELAMERQRLIKNFSKKDVVCDVIAGAGPLSLTAAKKVWRVFANDASPEALKYLSKNVAENQLQAKIELYNMDSRVFIRKLLAFKSPVLMTQVVFSLPTSGDTISDVFKGAFDRQTWPAVKPLPTIHVYGYSGATSPDTYFYNDIVCKLGLQTEAVEVYRVREVESGRWLICASFQLPEALAFDD